VELSVEESAVPGSEVLAGPRVHSDRQAYPLDGADAGSPDDAACRASDEAIVDRDANSAESAITALYEAHAVGLIRLGVVMLGNRQAAEDVVQEAFCGLYRRWGQLAQTDRALPYVRASVLNGCRSELRAGLRNARRPAKALPASAASAEDLALVGEEHRQVLAALQRLPDRQREALVLRYFLDLPEPEIARSMGITEGTVKSTTSRALTALARLLGVSR
jgi:RNA polymerase sigma-70 factor (sigma-E family)